MATVIKEVVESESGLTKKLVARSAAGNVMEVVYITGRGDKNCLCLPSQVGCAMDCKFCHASSIKLPVRDLRADELTEAVGASLSKLKLDDTKPLLIAFMGIGEPLMNWESVQAAMDDIRDLYKPANADIRFSFSTMMPRIKPTALFSMAHRIKSSGLDVKAHLSLHFTDDELRVKWMPRATNIKASLAAMEWYKHFTGNPVEIHYTLIHGVNDSFEQMLTLQRIIAGRGFGLKFMSYNPKEGVEASRADLSEVRRVLGYFGGAPEVEYYEPAGVDIGASCGMFKADLYQKYTTIK